MARKGILRSGGGKVRERQNIQSAKKEIYTRKRIRAFCAFLSLLIVLAIFEPIRAYAVPQKHTPDYKVAFYPYKGYHAMDQNGKRSGYGYEMMQGISKHLQCTFSYVGYDKTASECEEMLRNGEIDIYTAARLTPEREEEFVYTTHPAITSYTCMNVKVGNNKIVPGDYSTYNGICIGLLQNHTYNPKFLEFVREKGFRCTIVYYQNPTELSNALVKGDVDALVSSYIRVPEDEKSIENFGETPYYIMARKEDKKLIEEIDYAIDCMNVEMPNWRTDLYNKYYGSIENNLSLTQEEQAFLKELQESKKGNPIRAVMIPDTAPYSWYEDGEAKGILPDIFREVAKELHLNYEIVPVSSRKEYESLLASGKIDIGMDLDARYEDEFRGQSKYKLTDTYLTTTLSIVRLRGASERIENIVTDNESIAVKEIASGMWPDGKLEIADSLDECVRQLFDGDADAVLLMSYTAQKLAREDLQNRLRVEIVPSSAIGLTMGVNADDGHYFYGMWEKTLTKVSQSIGTEIVQGYLEQTASQTFMEYMFTHPVYLVIASSGVILLMLMILLYIQSSRSKKKQEKIAQQLAVALEKAEEATLAKQNFFSKMSHDIRTPLNVVLGMTQVAQKYKNTPGKLDNALNYITKEGNYLLVLLNSILDVNQLEHGTIELEEDPFNLPECFCNSLEILRPLYEKKEQTFTIQCDCADRVVVGDENRLKQILINLASNANKYTNIGGNIVFRLEYIPDCRYRFTCIDNGIGMTEEFVKHICDDYVRAEDSRISKVQGTGLGMSVVRGFTELMGGTLKIESEIGKGSAFTVEIPFLDASEEDREAILNPVIEDEECPPEYMGKKVLLVEDNALNAEIAIELLQTIGLTVDWVENGELGLERYESSAIDEYFAVFMDMQMPVMDGVTATKMIRKSSRIDHDIPIFAMTANTFASDQRSCREAGMNGYIPKPVSVKDIEDALIELEA